VTVYTYQPGEGEWIIHPPDEHAPFEGVPNHGVKGVQDERIAGVLDWIHRNDGPPTSLNLGTLIPEGAPRRMFDDAVSLKPGAQRDNIVRELIEHLANGVTKDDIDALIAEIQ
jgi:hypothetical protein